MLLYITYCSRGKSSVSRRVEDFYRSGRVRRFIEACSSKDLSWAILSARYGLLFPGSTVEPYDVTLRSVNCKSCFLGVRVLVEGKKPPIDESNRYLRDLCTRISSQLTKHGVEKVVMYVPNPYRARSYIKILQSAWEGCRDVSSKEEVLPYVEKENQIRIITKLKNLVDGSHGG